MRFRFSGALRQLAVFVCLVLFASGCLRGSDPEAENPNDLVMAIAVSDQEAHEAVVAAWNRLHPDRPVRLEFLPEDADTQRIQLGLELNAQGSSFDVIAMDTPWTGEFASYGWVEDLSDLRPEAERRSLAGSLESAIYQDRLWALPYNSNAGLLYYRTDLVPQPPATWDEVVRVGLDIGRRDAIAPYVGQGASYEGMVVNYLEYLWGASGDVLTPDGQVAFGTRGAAQQALSFMSESRTNGFYAPAYNTMQESQATVEFAAGRAVFMRNWPSQYSTLQDPAQSQVVGRVGVAPLPVFVEGSNGTATGGFNLAVSSYSTKKDRAREFVRWASWDPLAQQTLADNSLAPSLSSAYASLQDDPVLSVVGRVLPEAHARPPVPAWNDISVAMQREVFSAYNGQKPPEQAVGTIQARLQELADRGQL